MQYLDFTLVVDKNNKPCVPILNGRAGYLLRNNKAKIINHDPLVIKRIDDYKSDFENRDIFELKIDSGYLNIGFSVSDNYHEYLAGQVELLKGMSDRLTNRNGYRRTRRSRIRYRKNKNVDYKTVHNPTYKNGNEEGWFAPSIQHKIDSHIRLIDKIASWVPVDKVIDMTQEEHDRKTLMERVAVEELLLQEHISIPAAYERAREYVDRYEKESKLEISNDY